jgi:hypothetical protein
MCRPLIVQDIAVTCEQLLGTSEGGDGRAAMLDQLARQFEPNNVVDMAYATDQRLHAEYTLAPAAQHTHAT